MYNLVHKSHWVAQVQGKISLNRNTSTCLNAALRRFPIFCFRPEKRRYFCSNIDREQQNRVQKDDNHGNATGVNVDIDGKASVKVSSYESRVKGLMENLKTVKQGDNKYLDRLRDHFNAGPEMLIQSLEDEFKEATASALNSAGVKADFEYLKMKLITDKLASLADSQPASADIIENYMKQRENALEARAKLSIQREILRLNNPQSLSVFKKIYPDIPLIPDTEKRSDKTGVQKKSKLRANDILETAMMHAKNGYINPLPLPKDDIHFAFNEYVSKHNLKGLLDRVLCSVPRSSKDMYNTIRDIGEIREALLKEATFIGILNEIDDAPDLEISKFEFEESELAIIEEVRLSFVKEIVEILLVEMPSDPISGMQMLAKSRIQECRIGWKRKNQMHSQNVCLNVLLSQGTQEHVMGRGIVLNEEGRESMYQVGSHVRRMFGDFFISEVYTRSLRTELSLQSAEAFLHGLFNVFPRPTKLTRRRMRHQTTKWPIFENINGEAPNALRYDAVLGFNNNNLLNNVRVSSIYSASMPVTHDLMLNETYSLLGMAALVTCSTSYNEPGKVNNVDDSELVAQESSQYDTDQLIQMIFAERNLKNKHNSLISPLQTPEKTLSIYVGHEEKIKRVIEACGFSYEGSLETCVLFIDAKSNQDIILFLFSIKQNQVVEKKYISRSEMLSVVADYWS